MKLVSLCATAAACVATAALAPAAGAAADRTAPAPVNLIRDAGAAGATPTSGGDKVHVKGWTVSDHSQFTAVAYGAPGFPDENSPGPKHRGKNFFAGGPSGDTSKGTQTDSLQPYRQLISAGKAHFVLAGWLGGYDTQRDDATLSVTWLDGNGQAVGDVTKLGPVTEQQRKGVTGLRHRQAAGAVPKSAHSALITLHMVRVDGAYIDGYADNLSLTIAHK